MVVNINELLKETKDNAILQFNIHNLEWTKYILEVCNELKKPVILGVSEGSIQYMGGYLVISNLIRNLIKSLKIQIPVVIHLDHGSSVESCKTAIDSGFTSVMIDASKYDLSMNINITKQVVSYAHQFNVTVETEIGCIGNNQLEGKAYSKVEDIKRLVNETNADFLAPAVGNQHGIYIEKPKLDFELIKSIKKITNIPLVLHGSSFIPDDDLKKAISFGITKININSEIQMAWANSVRKFLIFNSEYDPRKIIQSGEKTIKEAVKKKFKILDSM